MNVFKEGIDQIKEFYRELNESWSRNIPFINKMQRKVRRIFVYRIREHLGTTVKEVMKCSISSFKRYFNLTKDNVNKLVGFTPDYVGFRPGKHLNLSNYVTKSINKNFSHIINNFTSISDDLTKSLIQYREVWGGGVDTNMGHLKEMLKTNASNMLPVEAIFEIMAMGGNKWIAAPSVRFENLSELDLYFNYNPKSNPGHYTSKILAAQNKGYTNLVSLEVAKNLFKRVRQQATKNFYLWSLGAREKDAKIDSGSNKEISTRVVLFCEEPFMILAGWVFQKIMSYSEKYANKKYSIKGSFGPQKYQRLLAKKDQYDLYLEADWSQFDANVDTSYLIAGACLGLSNVKKDTKQAMRFLYYIISSIVTKYVVVPPGVVIELNRSNASGHPCVTAVNCWVNLIYWSIIGYEIYGKHYTDYMDVEVYGDDALVFFKEHHNLDKIDKIISRLNLKSEPLFEKLKFCNDNYEIHKTHDFLKRRFSERGLVWNRKKLFDKIIYQSRDRNVDDTILLLLSYIETAPHDEQMNEFLQFTINDIINDNESEVSVEIKERVVHNFNKIIQDAEDKYNYSNAFRNTEFLSERNVLGNGDAIYLPRVQIDKSTVKTEELKGLFQLGFSLDQYNFEVIDLIKRNKIETFHIGFYQVNHKLYITSYLRGIIIRLNKYYLPRFNSS